MFLLFFLSLTLLYQPFVETRTVSFETNGYLRRTKRAEGPSWDYTGENGPENWSKNYPACAGKQQSPIKFTKRETTPADIGPLHFNNYEKERCGMILRNNGHTVELVLPKGEVVPPSIEFGGLSGKYNFSNLHFHWGRNDYEGSEHVINKYFGSTMEMHLVHVNQDEQRKGNTGIAVVALQFQAVPKNRDSYTPITDALDRIRNKDMNTTISENFPLLSLLPDRYHRSHFYRYNGSLTTPPCTEGVIWTIFEDVFTIGSEQIEKFRLVKKTEKDSNDPQPMAPNFRPIQDRNNRVVSRAVGRKHYIDHVHH